ncbi:DUF4623 domain-containing protein [Niabella pedocola]|uniref:DUF4623 domain-containing protein n=1 Tax=Niabella pedocola TaxID=1752077 RepID=A0ABS8PPW2_9BACT|nr:DUF4623 domain-containing protein [Niabella pedocola]MCD2423131.1 DUF4623 domain-containing protein [Niabella pedocola]
MIKNISKYTTVMMTLLVTLLMMSCQKKYPANVDSTDEVVLKSIKIVNAGANRNTTLEGTIDENSKSISFPRLDTMSDFSNLRIEAVMSDGAALETTSFQLDFKDGSNYFIDGRSTLTKVVKVKNNMHFREYFATLVLKIPPFGADFAKPQIYDYSNNSVGNPTYPDFVSQSTRWTGFDGNKVLIVARTASNPHLLNVSDLKQNVINKIPLNLTGVTGGTFAYSSGAQINGHTYICNLASAPPLKIYHWTDPAKAPDIIGSIPYTSIPTLGSRYGDNMSVSLDANGNGYMFFGDNNGGSVNIRDILRVKVTNYTTLSEPVSIPAQPGVTAWMTMTGVPNTNEYVLTGYAAPINLVNESGALSYTLANNAVPIYGTDARIFTFNRERYLIMTGAARDANGATVLFVYDITKGATTKEALEIFNNKADKTELFKFPLMGPANGAPGTQSGWYITKDVNGTDDKLTLFAASADAGFVMIDFPKKALDD